jgi:hypothetical protein
MDLRVSNTKIARRLPLSWEARTIPEAIGR